MSVKVIPVYVEDDYLLDELVKYLEDNDVDLDSIRRIVVSRITYEECYDECMKMFDDHRVCDAECHDDVEFYFEYEISIPEHVIMRHRERREPIYVVTAEWDNSEEYGYVEEPVCPFCLNIIEARSSRCPECGMQLRWPEDC